LWDALFLRELEIGQFLAHVREVAAERQSIRYIHPALTFCAYTGARRSEMFRCEIDDVGDKVLIREKKRSRDRRITFREVPLHPNLRATLDEWLEEHPGGQYLFCKTSGKPLEDRTSRSAFAAVTAKSRWSVLRGFHILRHSFASNLARHGVDQYKIDQFMGHQTAEMRERYRHLFPEDAEVAIGKLDFSIQDAAV
jgi:integrase